MFELLGAIIGAIGMYLVGRQTNESNAEITQQSQEFSERMMDKQNEYDTPANQVKRAQEAGINPVTALMSGGNIFQGNRSASPLPASYIPSVNPMEGLGQTFAQLMSGFGTHQENLDKMTFREARLRQIQEQTNQLRADVKLMNLQADAQQIANTYANAREQWALLGQKSQIRLNYSQEANFRKQLGKLDAEIREIMTKSGVNLSEIEVNTLRLDELVATIKSLEQDVNVKQSQVELNNSLAQQAAAGAENLQAQTEGQQLENWRYDELTDSIIKRYGAEIKNLSAQTKLTEEEAYYKVFDIANKSEISVFGVPLGIGQSYRKIRRSEQIGNEIKKRIPNYGH